MAAFRSPHLAKFHLQDLRALAELHPAVLPHGRDPPEAAQLELGDLVRLREERPAGRPVGDVVDLRGGQAHEARDVALRGEGRVVKGMVVVVVVDVVEIETDVMHDIRRSYLWSALYEESKCKQ